jgi:cation diffusion facilitator CzcD-associated flavoprotein CzcO
MKQKSLKVAVVGAGMSGLFLGYHLARAGLRFTLYEKRGAVGGTWDANTYPGLHVDVLTRNYEFPFARSDRWSRHYAPGPELRSYFADFAKEEGLLDHIRFNTEVTSAVWENGSWTVTLSDGSTDVVDVVVAATGFLRVPRRPNVPGVETFAGRSFHSSEWDHSIDLQDMSTRFGVVGTGSSGVQIVSALGEAGHDVTHFIRTPQWMVVKPNPEITADERELLRDPVEAEKWDSRMRELRAMTEGSETWRLVPGPEREEMTQRFLRMLEDEIPDPGLRAKLTPTEPLGSKRIPKTANYYQVVQQSNVHPVFGGIQRVEPRGIVDPADTLHELDVIVYATGFDAHAYMRPMSVVGADGVTMEDAWADGVTSFRGIAVPSFPNFFLLNGPFAPVNSISIPTCLADEVGYLMRLFDEIVRTGQAYAPTAEATQGFVEEIREALPGTTYAEGDNWYSQTVGTPIIWPFTRQRHHDQYAELDLGDFEAHPMSPAVRDEVGHVS